MNEGEFVRWLKAQVPTFGLAKVGIGDDAAVLGPSTRETVTTSDMLMDGVDFDSSVHAPELIGRKSMAVNLSDIAAMGCIPTTALVSVALPKACSSGWLGKFAEGIFALCRTYEVEIVGGDTNSWSHPLAISVTLNGTPLAGRSPILRSGARNGDWLMVSGPLGGSIFGRHLNFEPKVGLGQWLSSNADIRAMMDISDGLSSDLPRLCESSGVGAIVYAESVPIHDEVKQRYPATSWLNHALSDGEDFELLFCCSPKEAARIMCLSPFGVRFQHIGVIEGSGVNLRVSEKVSPLIGEGYIHSW